MLRSLTRSNRARNSLAAEGSRDEDADGTSVGGSRNEDIDGTRDEHVDGARAFVC